MTTAVASEPYPEVVPPKKKFIDGWRPWSISVDKRDSERPISLIAHQTGSVRHVADRQIRIRMTPTELRWLLEHAPKVLMEFDICRVCTHPRSQHAGVQGELVRGVCSRCDQYCTKFVPTSG